MRLKLIGETLDASIPVPPADPAADARKAAIQAKLDAIIIPRIHFADVCLDEAIGFRSEMSDYAVILTP